MLCSAKDVCPLNVRKPCPLDYDVWIRFFGDIPHFRANVLTLSITVGPDEQYLGVACFTGNIRRHIFSTILRWNISGILPIGESYGPINRDYLYCPGLEESTWWARTPFPVAIVEIPFYGMAENRGHGGATLSPRVWEAVSEVIVLDVLVSSISCLGTHVSDQPRDTVERVQTFIRPPLMCPDTAFAIEGFSATHKILPGIERLQDRRCSRVVRWKFTRKV